MSPLLTQFTANFDGGAGNNTYHFVGSSPGNVQIMDSTGTATIDLSSYRGGGASLDLAQTATQQVGPGLQVALSSGTGILNVVGTPLDDHIYGNGLNNTLSSANLAEDNRITPGTTAPGNGRWQVVYLDFSSTQSAYALANGLTTHQYTPDQEDQIVSIVQGIYQGYNVVVTRDPNFAQSEALVLTGDSGNYQTVYFNASATDDNTPPIVLSGTTTTGSTTITGLARTDQLSVGQLVTGAGDTRRDHDCRTRHRSLLGHSFQPRNFPGRSPRR